MHSSCKECSRRIKEFNRQSFRLPCDIEHPDKCFCGILYPFSAYQNNQEMIKQLEIGDKIKDRDGTVGIVIEKKGDWVRFKCRPYAIMPNLLIGDKDGMRIRRFWNMRKNLTKIE